ncbi:ABC transporter permease [Mucilaginibacter pocheonensis]|uniref:ABC transport system permease protein n=1 Tax=Mucilaginibacter pocheonensis TaxID=398050 RepID=A0ABU1T4T4_9SPHI|nr:ABC transporter permease [Mucilaginibacter pocheonensis]MDR6940390.1 putative ABC transport system permease protein [Mucilaginibacter pocheonensis]
MIKSFIKLAFKSLLKNKGVTAVNILGLAMGLAVSMLIVFYVTDELSYDHYNTNVRRIYRVNTDIKFGGNASSYAITPPPLAATLVNDFPEVESATRLLHDVGVRIKKGSENIQEDRVAYSDPGIFSIFTLPMMAGDPKTALKAPNTAVITESTAKRYFNSTQVIGKTLVINNTNNYKITGVIKDIPSASHFNFDFFLSMASKAEDKSQNWLNYVVSTYILLKPNASPQTLTARLPAMVKRTFNGMANNAANNLDVMEKHGDYVRMNLTPLTDIHLRSNRQYELGANSSIQYIYIFSAVALFILLLACINFMNISTARSANRAREVGVRKVMGSSRASLIKQFLTESVLVTLIATIAAVLAAWALLPLFNEVANKNLSITPQIAMWLLPVLIIIVLAIGILAGSYPAFFLSAFQPADVLKGKLSAGFKGSKLRNFLVVFQFSISIFLIVGTVVIYNQLHYIQSRDMGFNRNQVLIVKNAQVLGKQAKILQQQVKQLPGVLNATLSGFLPTKSNRAPDAVFSSQAADPKSALFTEIWNVDEDYLSTMGMKVIKGRNFSKAFGTDSSGVLINEAAAKMLGYYNDPLTKKVYRPTPKGSQEYRVLGIVKDFNFNSLRENITPVVMFLAPDNGALSIRVNTANFQSFVPQIKQMWKNLNPNEHFEYSFMDADFDAAYRTEQRTGTLFLIFTTLAVIIACLGLFSLAAYAAEQRNKEIGIRKVLGASVSAIVAMLSKDFIKLVLVSFLIAAPLAWLLMNKWLQEFAYRQNVQWWVFVVTALATVIIAFITISFQSVKAAMANPVDSLKNE